MNYYFLLFQFFTVEIWKDIPGYDGKYQVSSFGRVMNIKKGTIRKKRIKNGYDETKMMGKYCRIHRLVGFVFIVNVDNKPYINHITGIRDFNYWWALEWCTNIENVRHDNVNKSLHPKAKTVGMYSRDGVFIKKYVSCLAAAKDMNLLRNKISENARGIGKTCGGYVWKYI